MKKLFLFAILFAGCMLAQAQTHKGQYYGQLITNILIEETGSTLINEYRDEKDNYIWTLQTSCNLERIITHSNKLIRLYSELSYLRTWNGTIGGTHTAIIYTEAGKVISLLFSEENKELMIMAFDK
jgi:predicted nucleic acid-binding protein